jgi:hypothetical protein
MPCEKRQKHRIREPIDDFGAQKLGIRRESVAMTLEANTSPIFTLYLWHTNLIARRDQPSSGF